MNDELESIKTELSELEKKISQHEKVEAEKVEYENEKQKIEQSKLDEDTKAKKENMLGAIKNFLHNMVKSEEQYLRFQEMEKEDEE